jgi:CheY-like chemotaxis protein
MEQREKDVLIQFKVEDTGIGIAEDKQQQIFDRFTQADSTTSRSSGGTGLGLAICKRIIEAQGGKLLLRSTVGKGSVFYFTLAFSLSKATEAKAAIEKEKAMLPNEDEKPLSNNYILLVEDNPINVLVAQSFLERWGANIDVATNGQEALDMLDVNKHQLILMDMHMPIMDGYEATRRIRAKGIMLPIIALTASIPKDIEYQVRETGMTDIVVKPFVPDDLYRTILHFIKKQA